MQTLYRVLPYILFLFVLGWGAAAFFVAQQSFSVLENAQPLNGVVVANTPVRDSDGDTSYRPIIEYQPPGGAPARLEPNFQTSPPLYAVGDQVTVLWNSARPDDTRLKSFMGLWLLPTIFGALAAVALLITLATRPLMRVMLRDEMKAWPQAERSQGVATSKRRMVNGKQKRQRQNVVQRMR